MSYIKGEIAKCELSMEIVCPEKRGKKFIYGMDVSPNSKIFVEFSYVIIHDPVPKEKQLIDKVYIKNCLVTLKLEQVRIGQKVIDFKNVRDGDLINHIESPFPIIDSQEFEYGNFKIPIQHEEEYMFFEFLLYV